MVGWRSGRWLHFAWRVGRGGVLWRYLPRAENPQRLNGESTLPYQIEYSPDAEDHLRGLTARQQAIVLDTVALSGLRNVIGFALEKR